MVVTAKKVFIFGERSSILSNIEELCVKNSIYTQIILNFRDNFRSAIQVGSIPFQLTQSAVIQQRFQQIQTSERIRALKIDDIEDQVELEKKREKISLMIARNIMDKELADPAIIEEHSKNVLKRLDFYLSDNFNYAQELLRQVLVLLWGSFEVLINDGTRKLLNAKPELIERIVSRKEYKDTVFNKENILANLKLNSFNLSAAVGDLFCDTIKIDNLVKMRDVCHLLLDDEILDKSLRRPDLWLISQRRHLIVHRRGVIDSSYISQTSDTYSIGTHLQLDNEYIEQSMLVLSETAFLFISACLAAA